MKNTGIYTNLEGKTVEFNYVNEISLSQKVNFIMEHAGMVVSGDIGYASVLKKPLFDYCLVKYFTDIELFKTPEDFSLNMIDKFLAENKENVLDVITKTMCKELYNEMVIACDEAIEFRKSHFSDFRDEIADLLQAIRELVIKPDALSELLSALTNALNSFADKDDIDIEMVNKLANIIPIMEKMDAPNVAKTIIELHKHDTTVENSNESAEKGSNVTDGSAPNLKVIK